MRDRKWKWWTLWMGLVLAQGGPSFGLVITGGDGAGNTAAPSNDPGWANVGSYNDGGCAYLGNGWVLTAGHVYNDNPAGDPVFGTTPYAPDGAFYRIQNPADPSYAADLVMFHLATIPAGLPALTVSSSQPAMGSQITAIGYGYDRQSTELYWNSSWQPLPGPPAAYAGYELGSAGTKRWGTNTIGGSIWGDDGTGTDTNFLDCQFSSTVGPNSFQVASGDSGGGVFYQGATGWQLTGIILAMGVVTNQPGGTVVFDNASYFANLSAYSSQINHVVLSDALPGDANLDGRVDINDLSIVLMHYNQTGMAWSQGDFNGDGKVDFNDLTIVVDHLGHSIGASATAAVPEPAAGVLLAALLATAWAVGGRGAGRKSPGLRPRVAVKCPLTFS